MVDNSVETTFLPKVMAGKCCVPDCENSSQLYLSFRDDPPMFCDAHLLDGSETHYGEYKPTKNPYYDVWTCCGSSWKICTCKKLRNYLSAFAARIPISDLQRENFREKERRAEEQAEENRRMEAMYAAGHDEAYDR